MGDPGALGDLLRHWPFDPETVKRKKKRQDIPKGPDPRKDDPFWPRKPLSIPLKDPCPFARGKPFFGPGGGDDVDHSYLPVEDIRQMSGREADCSGMQADSRCRRAEGRGQASPGVPGLLH